MKKGMSNKEIQAFEVAIEKWKTLYEEKAAAKHEALDSIIENGRAIREELEAAHAAAVTAATDLDPDLLRTANERAEKAVRDLHANKALIEAAECKTRFSTTEESQLLRVELISAKKAAARSVMDEVVRLLQNAENLLHQYVDADMEADDLAYHWDCACGGIPGVNKRFVKSDILYQHDDRMDDERALDLAQDLTGIRSYREAVGVDWSFSPTVAFPWTCDLDK